MDQETEALRMEPKERLCWLYITTNFIPTKMSPKSGSNVCYTYKTGDSWNRWVLPSPTAARISPEVIGLHPEQPKLWTLQNLFKSKTELLQNQNFCILPMRLKIHLSKYAIAVGMRKCFLLWQSWQSRLTGNFLAATIVAVSR